MTRLLFIDWNPPAEAFRLLGLPVRWYGLCWVAGLLLAYLAMRRLYAEQGIDPAPGRDGKPRPTGKFDPLFIYCFVGVIAGARLGHCLFYDPAVFLTSGKGVAEMLLPVKFGAGWSDWHFTGYTGLASHGGAIGLFLALLLYIRRSKVPVFTVLDDIALVAPLTACFIRLGNLMNSEIIGRATDAPWAFVFHTKEAMVDGCLAARHPAQLYEAAAYLLVFLAQWAVYKSRRRAVGSGFYFGLCLTSVFAFRFLVEFLKEAQGGTDDGSTLLNVGQMLSVPFVLAGLWCMLRRRRSGGDTPEARP